jgi:hypothetical protein
MQTLADRSMCGGFQKAMSRRMRCAALFVCESQREAKMVVSVRKRGGTMRRAR